MYRSMLARVSSSSGCMVAQPDALRTRDRGSHALGHISQMRLGCAGCALSEGLPIIGLHRCPADALQYTWGHLNQTLRPHVPHRA